LPKIASKHAFPFIVDNTMASPYLCDRWTWREYFIVESRPRFIASRNSIAHDRRWRQFRLAGRNRPGSDHGEPANPYNDMVFGEPSPRCRSP